MDLQVKFQNLFGILILIVCVTGCFNSNPTTYPVRGIVRFPDGKLLREGTVEFELITQKNSVTATGEIMGDGSFSLGTFAMDDGALPGKHRAVVISDVEIGTGVERPELLKPSVLHQKYREFRTAGLRFEVKEEVNNIVIEVEYAPSPQGEPEQGQ